MLAKNSVTLFCIWSLQITLPRKVEPCPLVAHDMQPALQGCMHACSHALTTIKNPLESTTLKRLSCC